MANKTQNKEIEMAILELLENRIRTMSIREITKELERTYKIRKSPQIIKRHLQTLIDRGDIQELT